MRYRYSDDYNTDDVRELRRPDSKRDPRVRNRENARREARKVKYTAQGR